jgi:site-specific recombinase XerD
MGNPMITPHPAIMAYLDSLRAADKASTATTNAGFLAMLTRWLAPQAIDPFHATAADLARYQLWLANEHRTRHGEPLALSTQATAILVVKALYRWLHRRGVLLTDPAAALVPADPPTRLAVAKDHLSQQETIALLDTSAARVVEAASGSTTRALRLRDLAAIVLALATGRRCQGLCDLHLAHLDTAQHELRVEREKGKAGRVLPIAAWAVAVVQRYIAEARPLLLHDRESPYLLVSQRAARLCERGFACLLDEAVAATITRNPDLTDLPGKRISTHSLRVTFAVTLFANGCGIRSLNELMLHANLTTTAQYTPIPLEDLRRVLLASHPRA